MSQNDYNSHEKAALVAYWLLSGEEVTTRDVSQRLDITVNGAWRMLVSISRVLPVEEHRPAERRRDDPACLPTENPGDFAPSRWRLMPPDENPNRRR